MNTTTTIPDEGVKVHRRVNKCTLDVHPTDRAIVCNYELDCVVTTDNSITDDTAYLQRTIRIKNLMQDTDIASLAEEICDRNSQIFRKAQKMREVEQLLNYLKSRKEKSSSASSIKSQSEEGISMAKLDNYIEDLYEETEKVRASSLILFLAQNGENLGALAKHETLVGALARILREEGRKNLPLATNIVQIFLCFSRFSTFAHLLAEYKIGSTSMDLIEAELRKAGQMINKLEVLQMNNEMDAFDSLTKKYAFMVQKQDSLLTAAFSLLLNVSVEIKNEVRIINKGIIPLLIASLERKSSALITIVLNFLVKLSIYAENVNEIGNLGAIDRLCQLIPYEESPEITLLTLKLINNVCFNAELRANVVGSGLLPKLVAVLNSEEDKAVRRSVLRVLIHLASDPRYISHFAYTDAVQVVLRLILEYEAGLISTELATTAIHLATNLSNAQIICEKNGLKFLIKRAFKFNDVNIIKIVRNVSTHDGPSKQLFLEYVEKFGEGLTSSKRTSEFKLECARILSNLDQQEFLQVSDYLSKRNVISWLCEMLEETSKAPPSESNNEMLLELLCLCATYLENDADVCLKLLEAKVQDTLITILNAQQENDVLVVHVLYCFYAMLRHRQGREIVLNSTPIANYLMDLVNDSNKQVQTMCDAALDLLAEHNEQWVNKVKNVKFCHFNIQWIDMVEQNEAEGGGDADVVDGAADDLYEYFQQNIQENDTIFDRDDLKSPVP